MTEKVKLDKGVEIEKIKRHLINEKGVRNYVRNYYPEMKLSKEVLETIREDFYNTVTKTIERARDNRRTVILSRDL